MKRAFSSFLLAFLSIVVLSQLTPVASAYEDNTDRYLNLGFSQSEIKGFTEVDRNYLKGLDGDLILRSEKYFQITENGDAIEVPKQLALRESADALNNQQLGVMSSSSWLRMDLTVSQLSTKTPKEFLFKNSFQWLTEPNFTLKDVVGITHPEHFSHVNNSEIFKYTYDTYTNMLPPSFVGTKDVYQWDANRNNTYGMAFVYDLLGSDRDGLGNKLIVRNNRGYMAYRVTLNNNSYFQGSAHAHYAHTQYGISGLSIDLKSGSLSLSGAISVDYADDVGKTFDIE
ncbi:hypothetical protein FLT15_19370 [Paenibacillus thiaminolyticus]|nr:hypothetical protein [Paenibacillus thiaminolyticus]NGP60413.1 hypothetical protein [Paenibacillus thiaminolyticus]